MKLLIVDDDVEWLLFLKDLLDLAYLEIVTAHDGEQGLRAFEWVKPDFIITDTNMPKVDGIEFLREVRNRSKVVPVIVFFTYSSKGYTKESILKDGATAVIQKTEVGRELLKLLKSIKWRN